MVVEGKTNIGDNRTGTYRTNTHTDNLHGWVDEMFLILFVLCLKAWSLFAFYVFLKPKFIYTPFSVFKIMR